MKIALIILQVLIVLILVELIWRLFNRKRSLYYEFRLVRYTFDDSYHIERRRVRRTLIPRVWHDPDSHSRYYDRSQAEKAFEATVRRAATPWRMVIREPTSSLDPLQDLIDR